MIRSLANPKSIGPCYLLRGKRRWLAGNSLSSQYFEDPQTSLSHDCFPCPGHAWRTPGMSLQPSRTEQCLWWWHHQLLLEAAYLAPKWWQDPQLLGAEAWSPSRLQVVNQWAMNWTWSTDVFYLTHAMLYRILNQLPLLQKCILQKKKNVFCLKINICGFFFFF